MMLVIGGSPASIEHGINVFGSDDLHHCANILRSFASRCLDAVLPPIHEWQCRRIDVTYNYDLKDPRTVKDALKSLLVTDTSRRKATSDSRGGDSVYWSPTSDLISGKAYHKGPQLRYLIRSGKLPDDNYHQHAADLADNLLRLELKLASRFFRRLEKNSSHWLDITSDELRLYHSNFFSKFIKSVESIDMGNLLNILQRVAPTYNQALAAQRTYALISSIGYTQTKHSIPPATWYRHLKFLRAAGLTDADLVGAKTPESITPIRTISLNIDQPVNSWAEIERRAA
jgi:II/X family phage/plasmid replication protein